MKILSVALIILFASFSLGISSNEAVNLVVASNHYLYDNETYAAPNVAIEYENRQYWVIPLTANTDIITYFPVEVASGKLSTSRQVNRGLFEISDSLREFGLLRDSVSKSSVEWLFTEKFEQVFSELSLQLNDEVFQLNTVETTLESDNADIDLSILKGDLKKMSETSKEIAAGVAGARGFESEFIKKPSSASLSEMNDSFGEVFGQISELNANALAYRSRVDKVKQEISTAGIEPSEKAQLSQIMEPPQGLNSVRNYNLDSIQIKTSLESVFSGSNSRLDSLLSEFENRVLKNDVYNLLYSENAKLSKETRLSSLAEAQKFILSKEQIDRWKNTEKVNDFKQNYSKAVDFYNKKNFVQAQKSANLALDNAISVIKSGYFENPAGTSSQNLLYQIAAILLVLLALLFLFNNRGKIKGWLSGKKEEMDVYS